MKLVNILNDLICLAEKAADVARAVRQESDLFKLLVQDKSSCGDSRPDFKTLTDVLVQAIVKQELVKKYPEVKENFHGEENTSFTNTLGETIEVVIKPNEQETASLIARVLDGNDHVARVLAAAVHSPTSAPQADVHQVPDVDLNSVGIWIDPIDGTSQYVSGCERGVQHSRALYTSGLHNVTVLLGAFDVTSGSPLVGVVNQPFYRQHEDRTWTGRSFWSVSHPLCTMTSHLQTDDVTTYDRRCVLLSSRECDDVKNKLAERYDVIDASCCGYKLLCVARGVADAYLLTRPTCFRYDTCAPHSLLISQGGGIVNLHRVTEGASLADSQIQYTSPNTSGEPWVNAGGILAYRDPEMARDIIKTYCAILHTVEH